jgi:glutathione peroxidase
MNGWTAIWNEFKEKGLQIIEFPSDDFHQEPLSPKKLQEWRKKNKWGDWPLMAKIHVNGASVSPVYKWLRTNSILYNAKTKLAQNIPWNYSKFLVNNKGAVIKYGMPNQKPEHFRKDIVNLLES